MNTKEIFGSWDIGFAMDKHTSSSEFLGYSQNGNPLFETKRTALGELVYQGKYSGNKDSVRSIAEICTEFIISWGISPDIILPIPPTKDRPWNLVFEVCKQISININCKYNSELIKKTKQTNEIKSIDDFNVRAQEIRGAFTISENALQYQTVLLIDDLFSSGSTLNEVTKSIKIIGAAEKIHALTFTYTKS